ncbi:hypothetical protein MASR2M47_02080 [Draconibacterium sp.]
MYVFLIVHSFYDIEKVDKEFIDKKTASGNYYSHDFDNLSVENGRYTYLYICDDEMRVEWNKISKIKYDDGMPSGYPMYTIIYRYLTSKGLRKDAEGIKSLTPKDIQNIEHGITNVIFQEKIHALSSYLSNSLGILHVFYNWESELPIVFATFGIFKSGNINN